MIPLLNKISVIKEANFREEVIPEEGWVPEGDTEQTNEPTKNYPSDEEQFLCRM
jgi:hypothetical protein